MRATISSSHAAVTPAVPGAHSPAEVEVRPLRSPTPRPTTTATANETPGFAPEAVVRIEIHLGGSGAIDDLTWSCPGPAGHSGAGPIKHQSFGAPGPAVHWNQ